MRTAEQLENMFPIATRAGRRYPRLTDAQLSMVKRFAEAEPTTFSSSESLFDAGDSSVPVWFLLSGSITLSVRDGFDDETTEQILEHGQFTGELHALLDRPSLVGAKAGSAGCTALPLKAARVRALLVGSAELGELIMRQPHELGFRISHRAGAGKSSRALC